jgi:hypothetical protein
MNTLYPIIRRKRRPLIVADAKPVEPVKADPAPAKPETTIQPPKQNDETTPKQNASEAS